MAVEWPGRTGAATGPQPAPFRARNPDPIPARKVALQRTPAAAPCPRARLATACPCSAVPHADRGAARLNGSCVPFIVEEFQRIVGS